MGNQLKKYGWLVPVLGLLMMLGLVFSCNKNERKAESYLPEEIAAPAIENNNPGLKGIVGKKITGELTLYQFAKGDLLITVKEKNGAYQGMKFIIQKEGTGSKSGITKIPHAEVIYLFDVLIINDIDKNERIAFFVNSSTYIETQKYISSQLRKSIGSYMPAIGLSYNQGIWANLNASIDLSGNLYSFLHPTNKTENDDGGGGTCESGGTGSSSCSISGCAGSNCSVSCNAGYYACCRCLGAPTYSSSCTCIKNPVTP